MCFTGHPLDNALRTIRDLNFAKADLALCEDGPHLRPSDLTGDVAKVGQRLKTFNVPIAAFHAEFGKPHQQKTLKELQGVCRLARHLTVPVISTSAADLGSDLDAEIERLRDWVKIAEVEGVILTIATHSKTLTAQPDVAVELCRRVAGLGITLDPSHYVANGSGPIDYDGLYPYVRHVRLRDSGAKPESFQVRVGQGELEYGRIITQLDRYRYDRALSVDVWDTPSSPFPVEPEVRKLKYLLESLV